MSDEKTFIFKAVSGGDPFTDALRELCYKNGEEFEVTIRRVIPPKRRQWIFTDTGMEPRPIKPHEAYLNSVGDFCFWDGVDRPTTNSFRPLRVEIREVADGEA